MQGTGRQGCIRIHTALSVLTCFRGALRPSRPRTAAREDHRPGNASKGDNQGKTTAQGVAIPRTRDKGELARGTGAGSAKCLQRPRTDMGGLAGRMAAPLAARVPQTKTAAAPHRRGSPAMRPQEAPMPASENGLKMPVIPAGSPRLRHLGGPPFDRRGLRSKWVGLESLPSGSLW